jgi:hypothetical protein
MPVGLPARDTDVAGRPSVGGSEPPPAIVVMVPSRSTLRTRWFELSAIRRFCSPSSRTSVGKIEERLGGRAVVAAVSAGPVSVVRRGDVAGARDGADPPVRAHAADAVVVLVGDEELALAAHGHACRVVQLCLGGRATVAREPSDAGARDGGDRAVRIDAPDAVVGGIGDEHVAVAVDRDAGRILQGRRGRRGAIRPRTRGSRCRRPAAASPRSHGRRRRNRQWW